MSLFLVLLILLPLLAVAVPPLGKYKISDITVSGISSGAFMAVQMHVSHSAIINGSATFAGGPFYCAESTILYAEEKCMSTTLGLPEVTKLVELTYDDFALELVDNPANMMDDHIYIFSGKLDTVVTQPVVTQLQSYYQHFVKSANIVADYNIQAEHCLPTLNYGENCGSLSSPYIGKCNFDGAGAAFQTLFGSNIVKGTAIPSNLMQFDQVPFITPLSSLGDVGYIYVPSACADGKTRCRLHISFHGCNQNIKEIGNQYAANTGFNDWAEANNIIVLYPYAIQSNAEYPYNPNGCWDWWAYTRYDYGVKTGVQVSFVKRLIDHITSGF